MTGPEPPPSAITVREAEPRDAAGIANVHVESWRAAYAGLVPQALLDRLSVDRRLTLWAQRLREPGETRTFVADDRGRIVGFAGTARPDDPEHPPGTAELETIYLAPDMWHRGVGRKLMARSLEDLAGRGFASVFLWVLTGNERGRHFYEAGGWRPDGRVQMLNFDGTPIEEMRYRLELATA